MLQLDDKIIRKMKKELKGKTQGELIDIIISMQVVLVDMEIDSRAARSRAEQRNAEYLSRCRSVGGVTLPAGM